MINMVHSPPFLKKAIVYADCRISSIVYLLNLHADMILSFLYGFLSVFSENGLNADKFYRKCRTHSDISCHCRTQSDFFAVTKIPANKRLKCKPYAIRVVSVRFFFTYQILAYLLSVQFFSLIPKTTHLFPSTV